MVTAETACHKPPGHFSTNTSGQLFDEKSANQFRSELDEEIEHCLRSMALPKRFGKPGNDSLNPWGTPFTFSRLCRVAQVSYADFLMPNVRRSTKLTVAWETVPDPDAHALLKAVAMLFHRRVPLSTGVDLTKRDEELLCRRPPES